jgi:hypothetical protein
VSEALLRRPRCWLVREKGARVLVQDRGLIMGRLPDNDIILSDRRASSNHALVTATIRGLEVVSLGRNPSRVNGSVVQGRAVLQHGDSLEVPGGTFKIQIEKGRGWSDHAWVVEHPDGARYGLRQLPFTIGGSPDDHLQVEGWPSGAICFDVAQGALAVELEAEADLSGEVQPAGAVEALESGDTVTIDGQAVRVLSSAAGSGEETVLAPQALLPTRARFQFQPNGGRLEVGFADGSTHTVELAELRANLVAALLTPPKPYKAGELIPDETLAPTIWPGQQERGRTDLNLLLHRTRKNLLRAGINPSVVLARAKKGGATCFRLAPGAQVIVE